MSQAERHYVDHASRHVHGGSDPLPLWAAACRAYVNVPSGTIPDETTWQPPWDTDGVFWSSDGEDGIWRLRTHPFTGSYFRFDHDGSGGSGSTIQVNGPGLFLARASWNFGVAGDAIAADFFIEMNFGFSPYVAANVEGDDFHGPKLLDGYVDGGNVYAFGRDWDRETVGAYPASAGSFFGAPRGLLRVEAMFGQRRELFFDAFFSTRIRHTYGSALPFDSHLVISVVRLGAFERPL